MHVLVLVSINLHAKFEVPSFIKCKIWLGSKTILMSHVILATPLLGCFVTPKLGLATNNISTKFEVHIFPVTRISEAAQNLENRVVWGSYGSLKVIENSTDKS